MKKIRNENKVGVEIKVGDKVYFKRRAGGEMLSDVTGIVGEYSSKKATLIRDFPEGDPRRYVEVHYKDWEKYEILKPVTEIDNS